MQQQIFLCIGQEATFHQDRRTGDVVHQIDAVRDGLCLTGVARVQCGPQCLLCELCQRLTELSVGIEHLSAVVLPVRKGILVYAEQDSMLRLLDPGHTVVEVRDFFLPEGLRTVIMEGDIFTAQQKRRLAIQPQKLIQLLHNGQIDSALRYPGERDRASILPAVTCIQNQGLSTAADGRKGRLSSPARPEPEKIDCTDGQRGQQDPASNFLHIKRPLSDTV